MMSPRMTLALLGICLFAVTTATSLSLDEDREERSEIELLRASPDREASLRNAQKQAAELNQHFTAYEGSERDENGEEEQGEEFNDENEEDELINDNADDPLFDENEGEEEDEGEEEGEEEGLEGMSYAHKDADEDRFETDTVNALYPDSVDKLVEQAESDVEQDETADEDWDDFAEENDDENGMTGNVAGAMPNQNNLDIFDEENQRDNDQMVGQPFSPKVEKR